MAKISPVSSKYIIHAAIEIEGVVDRPDVIGAIFGQTEGLLGSDLELREMQRSGRIGRIEVNVDTKSGKSQGFIIIPSSLDKAETAIVGAALEIIQRIGPCNAKVRVQKIEDVRITKRSFVIERAKQLLKEMVDTMMPDSQEIADEVAQSVRIMEIVEYGRDRLPAGPGIEESNEVILVEGRADVLNLLKHGFKNVVAMNGTSLPQTVIDLSKEKEITVFVDGDRGGNLILRDLLNNAEIDFVTRAPDGKEVEELAKKEIHKALRSKITVEQAKLELASVDTSQSIRKPVMRTTMPSSMSERTHTPSMTSSTTPSTAPSTAPSIMPSTTPAPMHGTISSERREIPRRMPPMERPAPKPKINGAPTPEERKKFAEMLEGLIGTRGAYVLDESLKVLGKVPFTELNSTLKSLNTGVHAIVFDGIVEKSLVEIAERTSLKHIVAMDTKVDPKQSRVNIIVAANL